jgi:quercetin dioxygenase-like cupin family protein
MSIANLTSITAAGPGAPSLPMEIHAGARFTWHVTAARTGGAFCLAEALVPAGTEPPLHVHAREDETFYILEGQVTFLRGVERIEAGPGDTVLLPREIQHGFAVRTPSARMLVLATPGHIENAFRSNATPIDPEDADGWDALPAAAPPTQAQIDRITATFGLHGVEITGPPLPVLFAAQTAAAA